MSNVHRWQISSASNDCLLEICGGDFWKLNTYKEIDRVVVLHAALWCNIPLLYSVASTEIALIKWFPRQKQFYYGETEFRMSFKKLIWKKLKRNPESSTWHTQWINSYWKTKYNLGQVDHDFTSLYNIVYLNCVNSLRKVVLINWCEILFLYILDYFYITYISWSTYHIEFYIDVVSIGIFLIIFYQCNLKLIILRLNNN